MRTSLLLVVWMLFGYSTIHAQQNDVLCNQLRAFEESKKSIPAPKEKEQALSYLEDLIAEGGFFNKKEKKAKLNSARLNIRNQYWRNEFLLANNVELKQSSTFCSFLEESKRLSPNENPDLIKSCELNIAVVIDQSGSLDAVERQYIKTALETFVGSMIGSGNQVQFFGMGTGSVNEVNISTSILYGSGILGEAHLEWINNSISGLFSAEGDPDGWFTGLEAVNNEMPEVDLVVVISDGSNEDSDENILAGNVLKDNGAHIFVLAKRFGTYPYSGNSPNMNLVPFLNHDIMPNPTIASFPDIDEIATKDYHFFNDFSTLSDWMVDFDYIVVNNGTFTNIPECVPEDGSFSLTYEMDDIYTPGLFSVPTLTNNNYTLNDYSFSTLGSVTTITFDLTSNTCTCDGLPVVIKLKQKGCSEFKYLISPDIQCCLSDCKKLEDSKWTTG